jgi:hypothetical protein
LDGLVKVVSEFDQRTYRHEVIGVLIMQIENPEQLEERCRRYRKAIAGNAAVLDQPVRWVLSQEKPRQGARSC